MEPSETLAWLSGRDNPDQIADAAKRLRANPAIAPLLDAYPSPVVILNRHRQIVAANRHLGSICSREVADCVGMRLGEGVDCPHARSAPGGCGTSPQCKACGAFRAILACMSDQNSHTEDYLLRTAAEGGPEITREFRAVASHINLDQPYTVLVLQDVSDEKRRAALEKMFYHDLLNTAGALYGLLELWDETDSPADMRNTLHKLAGNIREQVQSARDLTAAERGDLLVELRPADATQVIGHILGVYEFLPMAHGRHVRYAISGNTQLETDETLLHRVLENLVKNALEASHSGQTVMLSYTNPGQPTFKVHSQTVIPPEIREWIFCRSFSTKGGEGNGIGLHSVRLLTEQYLGGKVTFESSEEAGTTFTVKLPAAAEALTDVTLSGAFAASR